MKKIIWSFHDDDVVWVTMQNAEHEDTSLQHTRLPHVVRPVGTKFKQQYESVAVSIERTIGSKDF